MSQQTPQHSLAQPVPSYDAASPSSRQQKVPSPRIPPCPILLHPLPSTLALTRESLAQSELELDRQTRQIERERALAEALQEQEWEIQRETVRDGMGTWSRKTEKGKERAQSESKAFATPPQAWELYKAIDKHDIEYIMRVRDHAFGLLLSKHGGEFPIVYAARQGDKWRDVVILIVGALSRYVNYLDEEDYDKKETRNTLKMLRSNLKVAIDNALLPAASAPHLLSSYLQVLIMSEGDVFLNRTINDLVLLLRDPESKPVAAAEKIIRGFCTKELRGVEGGVGDVEEYVANATLDLVIMGIWALGAGQVGLERLPTHTFARDTRTWTVFRETMAENEGKLGKVSGRVKRMLKVVLEHGGDTHKSVKGRLKDVEEALNKAP